MQVFGEVIHPSLRSGPFVETAVTVVELGVQANCCQSVAVGGPHGQLDRMQSGLR